MHQLALILYRGQKPKSPNSWWTTFLHDLRPSSPVSERASASGINIRIRRTNVVVTEYYETREDGVVLTRTYSDKGKYIIQSGTDIKYAEAIDPQNMNRTYTESTEDVPVVEDTKEEK